MSNTPSNPDELQELPTGILLEDMQEEEENSAISREEIRARTSHLIPHSGGDLKPYFEEMEQIGKEARE